jgi:RNA polymerase sigma-70 factor (ECF subfamily)
VNSLGPREVDNLPVRDPRTISTSLIRGLRLRDDAAWRRLVDLYAPLVFSWCRRAGISSDDSADVVQEVFQVVAGGIGTFRYEKPSDTFRGWLRTIAQNKLRDHFRRQAGKPQAAGGTDAQLRFAQLAADESGTSQASIPFVGMVQRAIQLIRSEFEDRTWQAFWLSTVEERCSRDVGDRLAMSVGAVRQAKYKVLRRLRQELGDAE